MDLNKQIAQAGYSPLYGKFLDANKVSDAKAAVAKLFARSFAPALV